MKKILLLISFSFFLFSSVVNADDIVKYYMKKESNHMFHLVGTGYAHQRAVPNFPDPNDTWCFGGLRIVDPSTNMVIGSANDCVTNVQENDGNVDVIGTTFMNLPGGTLVLQGGIRLSPKGPTMGSTTVNDMSITHITGASSGNNLIGVIGEASSGFYEDSQGNVRLSGMVDMSKFTFTKGDTVQFSCFFNVTELQKANWAVDWYYDKWNYPE